MINVKTLWNLFKIQILTQTDNHKFLKNVETDENPNGDHFFTPDTHKNVCVSGGKRC